MPAPSAPTRSPTRHFGIGLARAVGGAVIFSLPMLMTMEMWTLGVTMGRGRLTLLIALTAPLLVGLSHVAGFEETFDLREDLVDALVAYAVGFVTAALALLAFGVLTPDTAVGEMAGQVSLQAVPASIGALLAQSQLGVSPAEEGVSEAGGAAGYWGELFLMAVGALFLAFNMAPTEEMLLISFFMGRWHLVGAVVASLLAMHAFVYAVEFRGQEPVAPEAPWWSVFVRYTVVGYVLALGISAYILWTFGRLDGVEPARAAGIVVVLAVPAAIGAAAARLIL